MTSSEIRGTLIRLAVCVTLTCPIVLSQSTEQSPAFEVASIRPADPNSRVVTIHVDKGTYLAENIALRDCIRWAYDIQDYQLSGPVWLNDVRIDIRAKAADSNTNDDTVRLMLRSLLAERFALKVHREQKELPVYFLVLAKNGPRLHPPDANGNKFVASTDDSPATFSEDKTGLFAKNFTISEMAAKLSNPLKRPVIDKTGMQGRYDMRVDVTAYADTGNRDSEGRDHLDPVSVIQGAFQSQLGLKLQADKAIVDFVVVDSGNKTATDN